MLFPILFNVMISKARQLINRLEILTANLRGVRFCVNNAKDVYTQLPLDLECFVSKQSRCKEGNKNVLIYKSTDGDDVYKLQETSYFKNTRPSGQYEHRVVFVGTQQEAIDAFVERTEKEPVPHPRPHPPR